MNNRVWFTRSLGMIVLSIFLILWGLMTLFHLTFTGEDVVLGILALIAGILILLGL